MDFGTLIHTAQKNEKTTKNQPGRYYSTKFEPPKKEQRANKQLSANIKKFLAKQEADKRAKQQVEERKKDELLALRAKDKKATRRVNVMLKRTKSANQSVLEDAIDKDNTSVTLAGPAQPDEDDYGYVSQEAAAFYNKMMEKYSKMPEEPKFSLDKKKKLSGNLNSTKDRVRAALEREREEAGMPHKRRRKEHKEDDHEEEIRREEPVVNKKRLPPPPVLKFDELLKIAEKKQFEPIIIEQKPKEEEKLFTKKQKKEFEREREWRDRREGKLPPLELKPVEAKKPKVDKIALSSNNNNNQKPISNNTNRPISGNNNNKTNSDVYNKKQDRVEERRSVPPKLPPSRPLKESLKQPPVVVNKKPTDFKPKQDLKPKQFPSAHLKPKQFAPQDLKPKQFPPPDLKPKQFPPSELKSKQFPQKDLKLKQLPSNNLKPKLPPTNPPPDIRRKEAKKLLLQKRRIIDDDEEYDSEMDDFIDDGPLESEDYSRHIREIFGYDKSKYRHANDDDDCMESSFAQQMREEVISTKLGIMEDLEDMKKEEEEKRRKALMKKRKM